MSPPEIRPFEWAPRNRSCPGYGPLHSTCSVRASQAPPSSPQSPAADLHSPNSSTAPSSHLMALLEVSWFLAGLMRHELSRVCRLAAGSRGGGDGGGGRIRWVCGGERGGRLKQWRTCLFWLEFVLSLSLSHTHSLSSFLLFLLFEGVFCRLFLALNDNGSFFFFSGG